MQRCTCTCALVGLIASACASLLGNSLYGQGQTAAPSPKVLAGTEPLLLEGDLTSTLVEGVDRFLLKQLEQAPTARQQHWPALIQADRQAARPAVSELATMIGLRDERVSQPRLTIERDPQSAAPYLAGTTWQADLARWPVHNDVDASGIYARPTQAEIRFRAIVLPDAGQTPEQLIGAGEGHEQVTAWAARLAAAGGEVIVTTPISRHREARRGRAVMTDQEFLYRSAFELGRHVLGYQVNEALAAIDALQQAPKPELPLVVMGWGEGGWIALHTAAVSQHVDAVCISGHFQSRQQVWQEPIHRNLQGLLTKFGDAELAALIAPRHVIIDAIAGPQVDIGGDGGAPGKLVGPTVQAAKEEVARAHQILATAQLDKHVQLIVPDQQPSTAGASVLATQALLAAVGIRQIVTRTIPRSLRTRTCL